MSGGWERWSNPPRGREHFDPAERSVNPAGDARFGNTPPFNPAANVLPRSAPTDPMPESSSALSMFGNQDRDDRHLNPPRGSHVPPHATWQQQPDINNSRNAPQVQGSRDVPQSQTFPCFNEPSKQRPEIGPLGYKHDVDIRREKSVSRIGERHIKEECGSSSLTHGKATVEDDYDDFEKYLDAELDQNPKIHSGVTEKNVHPRISIEKKKDFQEPYDPYDNKRAQYSPSDDYGRGHQEKRSVSPHEFAARRDSDRADVSHTSKRYRYETARLEQPDRPRSPVSYKRSPDAKNWSPSRGARDRSPVGYADEPRQRSVEGDHKRLHEGSSAPLVDFSYDKKRSLSPKVKIAEDKLAKFSGLLADLICKDGIFKNYPELAHRNSQSGVPTDQGQYPYPPMGSRSNSPLRRHKDEIPALGDIPGHRSRRDHRSHSLSPRRFESPGSSSLSRRRDRSLGYRSPGRSPVRSRSTERYTDLNQYRNKSRSRSTSRAHSPRSRHSPGRRGSGHRHSRSPRTRRRSPGRRSISPSRRSISPGRRSISPRRAMSDRRNRKRSNSPASNIRSKRSRDGSVRSRSRSRGRLALNDALLGRLNRSRTRSKSPSFKRSPFRSSPTRPRDARDLIRNRSRTSRSPIRDVVAPTSLSRNRYRSVTVSPLRARSPLRRSRYSRSPDRYRRSGRSISPRRSISPFYDRGHLGRMDLRSLGRSFSRSISPNRLSPMRYNRSFSRSFSRSVSLSPPRVRSGRLRRRERYRNSTWDYNTGTWNDNASLTGSEYSSLDSLYSLSSVEYDTDKVGVNLKKPDSSETKPSRSKSSRKGDSKTTKKGSKSSKRSEGKTKDGESKPVEQAKESSKIGDAGHSEPAKDTLKEHTVTGVIPKEKGSDPSIVANKPSKINENVKSKAEAKCSIPVVRGKTNETLKIGEKQISDKCPYELRKKKKVPTATLR